MSFLFVHVCICREKQLSERNESGNDISSRGITSAPSSSFGVSKCFSASQWSITRSPRTTGSVSASISEWMSANLCQTLHCCSAVVLPVSVHFPNILRVSLLSHCFLVEISFACKSSRKMMCGLLSVGWWLLGADVVCLVSADWQTLGQNPQQEDSLHWNVCAVKAWGILQSFQTNENKSFVHRVYCNDGGADNDKIDLQLETRPKLYPEFTAH